MHFLKHFFFFLFYLLLFFLAFTLVDMYFLLNRGFRLGFGIITLAFFLFYLFRYFIPLLRLAFWPRQREIQRIAKIIGRRFPEIHDILLNFWQIYHDMGQETEEPFKAAALHQLFARLENKSFHPTAAGQLLNIPSRRLGAILTVLLITFMIAPGGVKQAFLKVFYPSRSFAEPLPTQVLNLSGDRKVLRNDPVALSGTYQGVMPNRLYVVLKSQEKSASTLRRIEIPLRASRTFRYEIAHVTTPFTYWFEGKLAVSRFRNRPVQSLPGKVVVASRPRVRNLKVKIHFPPYTGLPPEILPANQGEISALAGSRITVAIETGRALSSAWLQFNDSTQTPLRVRENRASGQFLLRKNGSYRIFIMDRDSVRNYQPVEYTLTAVPDEKPFVELVKPGEDVDLGEDLTVDYLINLRDDFGLNRLFLKGRVVRAGGSGDTSQFRIRLPIQKITNLRGFSEGSWSLKSFLLVPDDYIEYYAEAFDNNRFNGPGIGRSETFVIRLPSLVELLENSDKSLDKSARETESVLRDSKDLKKQLEELNREIKRDTELTWERRQEIREQLKKQKETMDKLQDLQKSLDSIIKKLGDQDVLSSETLEKYFKLQKMMEDIATPEMLKTMEKIREALEKADINKLKQALESFQMSAEDFANKIERTYELMKQVQFEQKLDELNHLAEKISADQQQINEKIAQKELPEADKKQLSYKENNLSKETDYLKKQIGDARQMLKKLEQPPSKELQKAESYMDSRQISRQMNQMSSQISQGRMQKARKGGKQALNEMQQLQSMLQNSKNNLMARQKQELMQELSKVMRDMLDNSFRQEQLARQSMRLDIASSQLNAIARKQSRLKEDFRRNINQIVRLSQKTFFISPQLNKTLSDLMGNMNKALSELEERNTRAAAHAQRKAMGGLNQAIFSLQSSMNRLSRSQSASGFQEYMKQLQKMAGQQGQLNGQTLSLFQQQQSGRLKMSAEAMARLAAQQEMIRRSLQQLNQESGSPRDILGHLDQLGQEMEAVIKELNAKKLDRKLIARQQKILSRMLDAQKSIREREFSKKREAERGKNVLVKSPPQLRKEMLRRENYLRKELLKAIQKGYSAEYKEFIKHYFEELSRREVRPN